MRRSQRIRSRLATLQARPLSSPSNALCHSWQSSFISLISLLLLEPQASLGVKLFLFFRSMEEASDFPRSSLEGNLSLRFSHFLRSFTGNESEPQGLRLNYFWLPSVREVHNPQDRGFYPPSSLISANCCTVGCVCRMSRRSRGRVSWTCHKFENIRI